MILWADEGLGCVVAPCDKVLDYRLQIEERAEHDVLRRNKGKDRMHIRSFFVLGGALLLIAANAFAGPKEDVAAATAKWGETLGQDDPDKVLALYAADAVLWGTLSPTVRSDRAALRDYFVSAFKILPGLKVSFGEQLIRVYGNTAVNTGYYTFAYTKDGEPKTLPARYSIVFVKDGQNWMIVDHHSSAMPTPPR
ncbi:MAG TPA: SgcJ/EcaC family oxidoreductase [Stellaceae bacterium]|nr:SgcJ/EcaC family oxidoreductase [Stellaceae bacterium]